MTIRPDLRLSLVANPDGSEVAPRDGGSFVG